MRSLITARQDCERLHPGLCGALEEVPFAERESSGSPAIELFRDSGGAGLLVPHEYGGNGVGALEAIRVMRGLSSYSPSLGAAVSMHHFTVAMLFALAKTAERLTGRQTELLTAVATKGLLMASGWAEGDPNRNILLPALTARRDGAGWRLNGSKKPCSLSASMDLLTASVAVEGDDGAALAVALIPAETDGISVRPFWTTHILAGAQSDEVQLSDVHLPDELLIRTQPDDPARLDDLQTAGFVWFILLISSVYLGAASALAERVVLGDRGSSTDRAAVAIGIESAVQQLEGVARAVDDGMTGDGAVAAVLTARYGIQSAMSAAVDLGVELLGGINFIRSSETAYMASVVRALAFHPPSRTSAVEPLLEYFAGGPLQLA